MDSCSSEVFAGVLLPPYWIILLCAAVAFPVLANAWKFVRIRCTARCCPLRTTGAAGIAAASASAPRSVTVVSVDVVPGTESLPLTAAPHADVVEASPPPPPPPAAASGEESESGLHFVFSSADLSFLVFQTVLQFVHFIYIVCTIDASLPPENTFHRYQHVYVRWIGAGGAPLTIAQLIFGCAGVWAVRSRHARRVQRRQNAATTAQQPPQSQAAAAAASGGGAATPLLPPAIDPLAIGLHSKGWRLLCFSPPRVVSEWGLMHACGGAMFLCSAPIFVTHILPMTLSLYIWTIPIIGGVTLALYWIVIVFVPSADDDTAAATARPQPQPPAASNTGAPAGGGGGGGIRIDERVGSLTTLPRSMWPLVPVFLYFVRLIGVLSLASCIATTTNYGTLWYSGGADCTYGQVIVAEWNLHHSTTSDGASDYARSLHESTPQLVAFMSLLL